MSIQVDKRSHNVAYQTARTDLLGLARDGVLEKRWRGNQLVFTAPADVADRLTRREKTGRV